MSPAELAQRVAVLQARLVDFEPKTPWQQAAWVQASWPMMREVLGVLAEVVRAQGKPEAEDVIVPTVEEMV